jgi:septal ring factor EnvC (AmiA/AmiB activator)
MRTKTTITIMIASVLILPFVGCYRTPAVNQGWQTTPDIGGANTLESPKATAVDSAIALSDRYAKLSEEASALRVQKQNLDAENQRLKNELKVAQDHLEKAQKDLDEVNDLLVEMRVELNNWKTDVLGFRGEMREAEKAQLEALVKILKMLGAEIKTDLPEKPEPAKAASSSSASVPEEQK